MPPKQHTPDSSPGSGKRKTTQMSFSSDRRIEKNNINLTYNIGLNLQSKNNSINLSKKPLKEGVSTQITFKGFSMQKVLKVSQKQIGHNVLAKSFDMIQTISPKQYDACEKIIEDFTKTLQSNAKFRKKLGFSEVQAKAMNKKSLWDIPQHSFLRKLGNVLISPFVAIAKNTRRLIFDNNFGKKHFSKIYNNIQETKKLDKIESDYKTVTGLFSSVEKWENNYRERFGFEKIKSDEEFLIPHEELQRNLRKRSFDLINPNIGKYSTKGLSVGTRIVSGILGAGFYGLDAYNKTMELSDLKTGLGLAGPKGANCSSILKNLGVISEKFIVVSIFITGVIRFF